MPVKICMQRAKSTFPKLKPSEELQKERGLRVQKHHTHTHKVSKGETKEKKKERAETFPNSTVTLMPRLLSILDSSMSNRSPGWRLLTSGLLALKVSVTMLGETPCKQRRAGVNTRPCTAVFMQGSKVNGVDMHNCIAFTFRNAIGQKESEGRSQAIRTFLLVFHTFAWSKV